MRIVQLTAAAIAATGLTGAALAQQPQNPQPEQPNAPAPQQQQETIEVTDSDLDAFTTIYVEIQQIQQEYQPQIESAGNAEEARQLQGEMRDSSIETIEEHGWDVQQYTQTARAINADQALREEAMSLIQNKSS